MHMITTTTGQVERAGTLQDRTAKAMSQLVNQLGQNRFEAVLRPTTKLCELCSMLLNLVIQFRCGKRQDTISDKRGIHNTRLTRHNRCGLIDSKCPVESLEGTLRRFDVQRHRQLVGQESSKAFCLLTAFKFPRRDFYHFSA